MVRLPSSTGHLILDERLWRIWRYLKLPDQPGSHEQVLENQLSFRILLDCKLKGRRPYICCPLSFHPASSPIIEFKKSRTNGWNRRLSLP